MVSTRTLTPRAVSFRTPSIFASGSTKYGDSTKTSRSTSLQPFAQRVMDDTDLDVGLDPVGKLNQNVARCPDEIVPNLDQPRA